MEFLQNNWFWSLAILFFGMYLFGGGGWEIGHQDKPKSGSGEESNTEGEKGCH